MLDFDLIGVKCTQLDLIFYLHLIMKFMNVQGSKQL